MFGHACFGLLIQHDGAAELNAITEEKPYFALIRLVDPYPRRGRQRPEKGTVAPPFDHGMPGFQLLILNLYVGVRSVADDHRTFFNGQVSSLQRPGFKRKFVHAHILQSSPVSF